MRTVQIQRINLLWFLTLGVTALAAGVLVYILLIESALGAFSIREATPALFSSSQRSRLLIHESTASRDRYEQLYPDSAGIRLYNSTLRSWEQILNRRLHRSRPAVMLDDAELAAGIMTGEDVLVLPASIVLSDTQIESVRSFAERGGSVLVSWGAGLYDEHGSWRGWDFMEDLFGIRFKSFVDSGSDEYLVSTETFRGTIPEGVYVPNYASLVAEAERFSPRNRRENEELAMRRRTVANARFAPLQDYAWFDTLGAVSPAVDHASVRIPDTLSSAVGRSDSVRVTYYTWIGPSREEITPYPRTGGLTRRFTLRAGTPITSGIPGGYRAKIQVYSPGVNMEIVDGSRAFSAGFWHDFATDDPVETSVLHPESGIVYGRVETGRFVFMGFGPDALGASIGDPEDELILARLYDNVIGYLKREPTSWTHDWPVGFDAALIVAPVVDSSAAGAESMLRFFEREGIPTSFFVTEHVIQSAPGVVSRMAQLGDVGLYDMRERRGVSTAARATGISNGKALLEETVGRPVAGYRSIVRGQVPHSTLTALTDNGFTYFLPDSVGRRTTPKIMIGDHVSLTRIGVTSSPSVSKTVSDSTAGAEGVMAALLMDVFRVLDEGGVYRISPTERDFATPGYKEGLHLLFERLRRENIWFASGEEVVRWWRLRRGLNTSVEQRSASRVFVRLSNDNGDTAEHATVSIALGHKVSGVVIKPELINLLKQDDDAIENPPHRLNADSTVLDLTIKQLKPQQYRIFHVDLLSKELAARFARN